MKYESMRILTKTTHPLNFLVILSVKSEDDVVKSKKVSIYRLFSYSKPDWVFITLGFIFLTISSTGNLALDI
jgi:hypothetical protein